MRKLSEDATHTTINFKRGCLEHQRLIRRCNKRNDSKYKSMTDYFAAAVEKLESGHHMTINIDMSMITEEEKEAVNILMNHRGNVEW